MSALTARAHATPAFEAAERDRYLGKPGVAYVGRSFRAYAFMRVGEAVRFYAAIHRVWLASQVEADLASIGLGENFEVRRLKRAYQRAFVLALAVATDPVSLVVEGAEEFDDARTGELLIRAAGRVRSARFSYSGEVTHEAARRSATPGAA